MAKRRSSILGMAMAMGIFLAFSDAQAVSYTLSSTIHMDDGNGNVLDINPVYDDTGTTTCLDGSCAGPDLLIFEVSVVSGSFEEIAGSALIAFPAGAGYINGADTAPSTGAVVGGVGRFDFDAPNLNGDSVVLFISYAALTGTETVSFSATPVGFVLFNETGGIIAPIPEPGTAALLALGLVFVGAHRRAQRRLTR